MTTHAESNRRRPESVPALSRAESIVELMLPSPVTVGRVTGNRVQWTSYAHGPNAPFNPNARSTTVVLFDDHHDNITLGYLMDDGTWGQPIPDWCPMPPAGWDAHVQAFIERLAVNAS